MTTVETPLDSFGFDNTYASQLEGFYAPWQAVAVADPQLLRLNHDLAHALGLDPSRLDGSAGAAIFSGNVAPPDAAPIAQAYAGHQFGGFSPQLGDGRALLLGEIVDPHGARFDIALKGSGRTPFSRGGDGRAALGPVLREYLMGEAMHALGVPTTRALAVVATGERVLRDRPLPGAVLTRVASSHLRIGTFQFFAARGEIDKLRRLVDYALARHDPELVGHPNPALALLTAVIGRQSALVATWMNVGFIHGVQNTDNVTVSGETIDYGPCAFIEGFDPGATFSSIDEGGRYAYGRQPSISKWNMARLAEALLPLIADEGELAVERATEVLDTFDGLYQERLLEGLRSKLALSSTEQWHDADRTSPTTGCCCSPTSASTSPWRGGISPTSPTATRNRCNRCSSTGHGSTPGCSAGSTGSAPIRSTRPHPPTACDVSTRSTSPATTWSKRPWRLRSTTTTWGRSTDCSTWSAIPTSIASRISAMPSRRRSTSRRRIAPSAAPEPVGHGRLGPRSRTLPTDAPAQRTRSTLRSVRIARWPLPRKRDTVRKAVWATIR